ncbi:MAG: D-2-hydroxyacid dehydrogenase [Gemmatimonadetes bacterium]|nr:D-2-hydroxyacid dehydrogenase [Gemmatimonadota bacterium]
MRIAVFNMQDDRATWALPEWAPAEIATALGPDWRLVHVREPVSGRGDGGGAGLEALAAARGAEIIMALGLPRDLLLAALEPPRALRWIHSGAAGVRSLLHPELVESDILLTNSAAVHAPPMAESVLGMVLHFARGFDFAVRAQAAHEWGKRPFECDPLAAREVQGATLGILGFGGVGREVATRARALGMDVLAVRRRAAPADAGSTMLSGPGALDELLARSDYLVVCAPSTAETTGLLDARRLALMKRSAVLINVARGDVVVEAALADALRSGHLRGAGLDVFAREPLPPDSPLWTLDNVLITPHVSGTTPRFWRREVDLIVDNVARYRAGRSLRNLVDKQLGY